MSYQLRAIDEIGGQALYEDGNRWFRIAVDNDWQPVELADRRAAIRCTLLSHFEDADREFESRRELIQEVRSRWQDAQPIPEVPIREIIHLSHSYLHSFNSVQRGFWICNRDPVY